MPRKRLGISCCLFFCISFSLAQTVQGNQNYLTSYQNWFGIKTGFVNTSYPFGLALHFGVKNPIGADLRISGSYQFRQGGSSLGLGADVLRAFSEAQGLSVYGGAGVNLLFESRSFMVDAHGLVGTEYRLVAAQLDEIGIFLELHLGAALALGNIAQPAVPTLGALLGFNIYF